MDARQPFPGADTKWKLGRYSQVQIANGCLFRTYWLPPPVDVPQGFSRVYPHLMFCKDRRVSTTSPCLAGLSWRTFLICSFFQGNMFNHHFFLLWVDYGSFPMWFLCRVVSILIAHFSHGFVQGCIHYQRWLTSHTMLKTESMKAHFLCVFVLVYDRSL